MIPFPDENAAARWAECPQHGQYRSRLWTLPAPRPDMEPAWTWTGCPTCVRQHAQSRQGWGRPDLREIHRPQFGEY